MMDIDEFLDKELEEIGEKEDLEEAGKLTTKEDINNILNKIREHIAKKEFVLAEELYSRIQQKLAEEPIESKMTVYDQLTSMNKELLKSLNELSVEMDGKVSVIRSLMEKGREHTRTGKFGSALKIYDEVKEVYSGLPEAFIEQKRTVQNAIYAFYKEIRDRMDQEYLKKFDSGVKDITKMIAQARFMLDKKSINEAARLYRDCTSLYNQLPEGFLKEKASIYNEILKLYEEVNLNVDIIGLQKKLETIEKPMFLRRFGINGKPAFTGIKKPDARDTPKPVIFHREGQAETVIAGPANKGAKGIKTRPEKEERINKLKEILSAKSKLVPPKAYETKAKPETGLSEKTKQSIIQMKLERGALELNKGMYEKAAEDFREILRLDPGNSQAKDLLQRVVQGKKEPKKQEIKTETKIQAKDKKKAAPIKAGLNEATKASIIKRKIERGALELNKGMYEKAAEDFREILRLDPDNSQAKDLLQKAINKRC